MATAVLTRPGTSEPVGTVVVRGVAVAGGITAALVAISKLTTQPSATGSTNTMVAAAVVIGLICLSAVFLTDLSDRLVIAIAVGSWILLNVPLLVVYPIPARTFLPAYVLLLMIVSVLTSNFQRIADAHTLAVLTTVVAVAGLMVWNNRMTIYNQIDVASNKRIELVRQQVEDGATHLEIKPLPYREWMARPDPYGDTYATRFKAYYELPEDVTISAPR